MPSEIFLIRSEMDDYPSNFGNKTKCDLGCPETLNSEHLFVCSKLNEKVLNYLKFEHILEGRMNEKLHTFPKIKENIGKKKLLIQLKIINCNSTVFTV